MRRRQQPATLTRRACPLLLALLGGVALPPAMSALPHVPSPCAAWAQELTGQSGGKEVTPVSVKAQFDAAMSKPLSERVPHLDRLAEQIGQEVLSGNVMGKEKVDVLRYKYLAEINQAKYNEAHASFGQYAQTLRGWEHRGRARATICEEVRNRLLARDVMEAEATATISLEHWADDAKAAPALLYYKARALTEQAGRADEALPALEEIIVDHPDSPWRPKALRWMAHLQANGYGEGSKAALQTLSLLESQYAGTWWEQYAHMKPAAIWERRMGEPQKALERYRETLEKFPDHKFATHCRGEIERLQLVIEEQLIRDALEGLGKADPEPAEEGEQRVPDIVNDPLGQMAYVPTAVEAEGATQ